MERGGLPRSRAPGFAKPFPRTFAGGWRGYDELGQLTSVTDKLGRTSSTTYDDAGRPITSTNRAGETVTMAYNTAGQLVSMTGPGVSRTFTYDALGRLTSGGTGEGFSVDNTWGPRGITAITQSGPAPFPTATWTLAYDEAAHPTHVVGPVVDGDTVQDVTYTWDDFGHLDTLTESTLGTFTFIWDAAGRPLWLERPGDAPTTYHDIDLADRHTRIRTGQLHVLSYAYDALGRLSELRDHEGTHTLQRDAHHRLTGVDRADGSSRPDESYTYDDADRRTAWTAHDAAEVVYDAGDRLTQDAVYTYTYDDEGRRIARTRRSNGATETYVWDALDQLVSRTDEAGTTWTHHYDAFGRRVGVKAVSSGGVTTYEASFVYDTNNLVRAVYDGVGDLTASYVTGMDFGQVLAEVDGATGDVRYALLDKQNSLVGWLDAETDEVTHVLRDAFGQRTGDPLTAVAPYGYTGHAEDPGGLVWGRARYLDPATGQWLSEDPVVTEDRYAYGANAPLSMTDPTGTVSIGYALVKGLDLIFYGVLGEQITSYSRAVDLSARIVTAAAEFQKSHPEWHLTEAGERTLAATIAVPQFVGFSAFGFGAQGASGPMMLATATGLGSFMELDYVFAQSIEELSLGLSKALEDWFMKGPIFDRDPEPPEIDVVTEWAGYVECPTVVPFSWSDPLAPFWHTFTDVLTGSGALASTYPVVFDTGEPVQSQCDNLVASALDLYVNAPTLLGACAERYGADYESSQEHCSYQEVPTGVVEHEVTSIRVGGQMGAVIRFGQAGEKCAPGSVHYNELFCEARRDDDPATLEDESELLIGYQPTQGWRPAVGWDARRTTNSHEIEHAITFKEVVEKMASLIAADDGSTAIPPSEVSYGIADSEYCGLETSSPTSPPFARVNYYDRIAVAPLRGASPFLMAESVRAALWSHAYRVYLHKTDMEVHAPTWTRFEVDEGVGIAGREYASNWQVEKYPCHRAPALPSDETGYEYVDGALRIRQEYTDGCIGSSCVFPAAPSLGGE